MDEHGHDVPEIGNPQRVAMKALAVEDERIIREYGLRHDQRRYLPTFAELVDRLTIVQLKAVFIPANKAAYELELADILHDIDLLLADRPITAEQIRAVAVLMLTNRFIWENESKAREGGSEQDKLLKMTHSVNGVRNTAKNILSRAGGERLDLKIDSLAADLPPEFGNWRIWG
jgi:hypothetical protein